MEGVEKEGSEIDSDGPPLKRVRLSYDGAGRGAAVAADAKKDRSSRVCCESDPPCFLSFHLDLLKSLASSNGAAKIDGIRFEDDDEEEEDEDMEDDEIFSVALDFLKHRSSLVKRKKEALRWKGIHSEAVEWSKMMLSPSSSSAGHVGRNILDTAARRTSYSPPSHHRLRQDPYAMMSATAATPCASMLSFPLPFQQQPSQFGASQRPDYSSTQQEHPRSLPASSLIAKLLGKRFEEAKQVSCKQTEKYQGLLKATERKIRLLKAEEEVFSASLDEANHRRLDRLFSSWPAATRKSGESDNNDDDDASSNSSSRDGGKTSAALLLRDAERSRAAATACQMRLWNMLAHDLIVLHES